MSRRRLDRELVARGLAADTDDARAVIEQRRVIVDGAVVLKASSLVLPTSSIEIAGGRRPSRAGEKLRGALEEMGIDVSGKKCLDSGAGHGGFTRALLEAGAREVIAVDVGYGLIDLDLRNDPRVAVIERTNLKTVPEEKLGGPFDLVTADLSFIGLTAVIDKLASVLASSGEMVLLVKPQFEAPREDVPRGGVVSDPVVWRQSLRSVTTSVEKAGLSIEAIAPSRVRGAKGNQEFFVWAKYDRRRDVNDLIDKAIESVG